MSEGREIARGEKRPLRWEKQIANMAEAQQAEAKAIQERDSQRPPRPSIGFKDADGGRALIVGPGDDEGASVLDSMRVVDAVGSSSLNFGSDFLRRLSEAVQLTGDNSKDAERMSAAIALVGGIGPQSELEATMALQMVAANEAALRSFERSRKADYMEHAQGYSNMANKAMRSFALHAEAIAKLRRGGEQVVKHVHVNAGGQAVIAGTVNTGGQGGE